MPGLSVRDAVRLVVENTMSTGYPVPAPGDVSYRWASSSPLPRRGRVYLYTGSLYQLVPYIDASLRALERFGSAAGKAAGLPGSRLAGLGGAPAKPPVELVEWSHRVVWSAAHLAARAVEGLAYLYEDDLYSGALLYDLGAVDVFAEHARRVYRRLRERGAEKLVTIDPHTTHVMREVYPRFVDGYSLEVVNYLEALEPSHVEAAGDGGEVVIHDPCLYARSLGIVEQPRRLLAAAGYRVLEPPRSRRDTYCCGGPVEAVAPGLALAVAAERLRELAAVTPRIATMCPVCYLSLRRAAEKTGARVEIRDIAELLAPPKQPRPL